MLSMYSDISDTILNYYYYSGAEDYYFDINNDVLNDFKITAYDAEGGAAIRYISISPLNVNSFVSYKRTDSLYNAFFQFWQISPVAKPLSYGDSINSLTAIWKNTYLNLTDNTGNASIFNYVNDWVNINDLYLGLKYQSPTDTIYAWIRLNCSTMSTCKIKDFSSSCILNDIKELEKNELLVYPNPTANTLNIFNENMAFEHSTIEIRNYFGQTIIKQLYSKAIDVSLLSTGIYVLKITSSDNQSYFSKFIKE